MPHSHITWIYTWITELLTELKALHRARSSKLGSVFQHPPYKNIKIFVMSSSNLLIIQSNPVNTGVRRRPGPVTATFSNFRGGLLPEVCSTEFDILSIRAFSDHAIRHILYYVYGQDFQPGVGGGGVLPTMAFSGRLRPKGVSFSGLGYMKECGIHY